MARGRSYLRLGRCLNAACREAQYDFLKSSAKPTLCRLRPRVTGGSFPCNRFQVSSTEGVGTGKVLHLHARSDGLTGQPRKQAQDRRIRRRAKFAPRPNFVAIPSSRIARSLFLSCRIICFKRGGKRPHFCEGKQAFTDFPQSRNDGGGQ